MRLPHALFLLACRDGEPTFSGRLVNDRPDLVARGSSNWLRDRLLADGLIERVDRPADYPIGFARGRPPMWFRISEAGRQALEAWEKIVGEVDESP